MQEEKLKNVQSLSKFVCCLLNTEKDSESWIILQNSTLLVTSGLCPFNPASLLSCSRKMTSTRHVNGKSSRDTVHRGLIISVQCYYIKALWRFLKVVGGQCKAKPFLFLTVWANTCLALSANYTVIHSCYTCMILFAASKK